jgi:predicted transposase/invertase (TIGR01784 family)
MNNYVKPSSDIFIKYLLGSERNKDLLLSFINAVFEDSEFDKIADVEIKNPFNIKTFQVDKESILDIKATDEKGRQFDIEVQSTGNENFVNRSLYYWARLYCSQLKESEFYTKLKATICINILDFNIFKETKNYHNCFLLFEKNDSELVLTDHLVLHYLELRKYEDQNLNNKLNRWIYYLKNEGKVENMKILLKDDNDMQKAHEEYQRFTEDDQLREIYESRIKWEMDYRSGLVEAEERGIKKGIEKGIEKDQKEIVFNMNKEGLSVEQIHQFTTIPISKIKKYLKRK